MTQYSLAISESSMQFGVERATFLTLIPHPKRETHIMKNKSLLGLLAALLVSACGAAPATSEDIASTQQALTPTTVEMWVQHFTPPPAPGTTLFRMFDDSSHPSSTLVSVQVTQLALPGIYSVSQHFARGQITAADWNQLSSFLSNGVATGSWVKVRVTYDNDTVGDQKAWTAPRFQSFLCSGIGLVFGPNCG